MESITGNWIGFYVFGEDYPKEFANKKVPFKATLQGGIYEFVGVMTEVTALGGIEDTIELHGKWLQDEIEFTKHYTKEHFIDENGVTQTVESESPTEVHYEGKLDESDQRYKATWVIQSWYMDEEGIVQDDFSEGTWEMWREPD